MSTKEVVEIARILTTLSGNLDALAKAGAGVPAVTQNAIRMRGTLQALQSQFADLFPVEAA
ncbi:MAG: hypothetical protein P1P84_14235 [Deferrisomatales bacterium]|nr:hypothetical protein [Deferrisomatales bacterium]